MTDLQHAYWLGEQSVYRLSTPAFAGATIVAAELDLGRLERALAHLRRRHPMLRARILEDGTQRIADDDRDPAPGHADIRQLSAAEQSAFLASITTGAETHRPAFVDGRAFDCFVCRVSEGYRLSFVFRLAFFDVTSVRVFFRELADAYAGQPTTEDAPGDYRDFLRRQSLIKESPGYARSHRYWSDRIERLPNAPDLPVVGADALPERSSFRRFQLALGPDEVGRLRQRARALRVTVNTLLCAAYGDVLRLWSRNASFLITLLITARPTQTPEFRRTIGNFGTTLLLEIPSAGRFGERAAALQRQLLRDLEHMHVSGVEVVRMMRRAGSPVPAIPVVFASNTVPETAAGRPSLADLGWRAQHDSLHTPHVWLDHQVYLRDGRLDLMWDVAEGVFLPGVIDDMFAVYGDHLQAILAERDGGEAALLPTLPPRLLQARADANKTARPLPTGLLHQFCERACREHPDLTAIIAPDRVLDYRTLFGLSARLAAELRQSGVRPNDLVAVAAGRGWRQVAALIATLQSGGAYLPVSPGLPPLRQAHLIGQEGVKVVLAEGDALQDVAIPPGIKLVPLEEALPESAPGEAVTLEAVQTPEDLAYVMFTSGSTGVPKGVAIDHRGAVNTLQDIVARFGLGPQDRVIAISEFNFDLSVYDIFASLSVGAALVIPPRSMTPSPEDWARCVSEHRVTVWNSVPALFEMQLEYLGRRAADILASLRLVMLSGDWIPVSLPPRASEAIPGLVLVGLGGATEASIWSNYFVIDQVDPAWKSIPYGYPLSNQRFHVLNGNFQDCPTWVPGQLHIAGIGLAKGYYRDPVRTAESFVSHPVTGEPLYRTGDLGRYHPGGFIEFLGREDGQVKIRGFRIELGEIEAALERHAGIRAAAAVVRRVAERDGQLVAFYVRAEAEMPVHDRMLRRYLARSLPDYMVPDRLVEIERIPVTSNGKIDRQMLRSMAERLSDAASPDRVRPRGDVEQRLARLWGELLAIDGPGAEDGFFASGGTSLMAVRLLTAIETEFGIRLPLASLFRHDTVAAQARLLKNPSAREPGARGPIVPIRSGGQATLLVVHPVGGNLLCYRPLVELVPDRVSIIGLESPGNGRPREVSELGSDYVAAAQSEGAGHGRNLHLLGWSMGGIIAHEMARLFEASGVAVASLTMVDSWMRDPASDGRPTAFELLKSFFGDFLDGATMPQSFDDIAALPDDQQVAAAAAIFRQRGLLHADIGGDLLAGRFAEYRANYDALIRHRPGLVAAPLYQYRARRFRFHFPALRPFEGKEASSQGAKVTAIDMHEDHFSIVRGEALRSIVAGIPFRR